MHYELNITIALESEYDRERVGKQMESLFEFGTMKEAIAEGLKLGNDPRLVGVAVKAEGKRD